MIKSTILNLNSLEQGGTVKVCIEAKTTRGSFEGLKKLDLTSNTVLVTYNAQCYLSAGFLFMTVNAKDSPSGVLGRSLIVHVKLVPSTAVLADRFDRWIVCLLALVH
jgi:hypothetical protein